jgi:uncharacterized repeat protein (TIGR01451 family)
MRKVLLIVTAVILAVAMLPLPAMAIITWNIDKSVSSSTADLGDHITFTLSGTAAGGSAKVTDSWSSDLTYIPGTLDLTGASVSSYYILDHYFYASLSATGSFTITFDVQVTEVQATTTIVSDTAQLWDSSWTQMDLDTEAITLYPYEGFEKWIEDWSGSSDPYNVPVETDVHWLVGIYIENISGDAIATMEDVVVQDRLGGDLELDGVVYVSDGSIGRGEIGKSGKSGPTGKTNKEHLAWTGISDMVDYDWAVAFLEISTDINPGTGNGRKPGHQEYTEAGEHDLNSGAVLKFTDPDTGLQLSAHTPPITVVAYEP